MKFRILIGNADVNNENYHNWLKILNRYLKNMAQLKYQHISR